jgi:hypothetical protein
MSQTTIALTEPWNSEFGKFSREFSFDPISGEVTRISDKRVLAKPERFETRVLPSSKYEYRINKANDIKESFKLMNAEEQKKLLQSLVLMLKCE